MTGQGEGRVALVTGATRGIGAGIAQRLAKDGYSLVVTGTTANSARTAARNLIDAGHVAFGVEMDVRSPASVDAARDDVVERFGRCDVLVNNAGISRAGWFDKMSEEDWDDVIDTNLKGPWLCSRAFAPIMRQHRFGRIVNIGAEAGLTGHMGMVNYVAAKAGLIGVTMALAREMARWIDGTEASYTCNLIYPGFNRTDMTAKIPPHLAEQFISEIPLGRVANAETDTGALVSFLASAAASYITGSKLSSNGGLYMNIAT